VDYYSYWQRPSARNLRNDINWDYAQVIRRVPDTLSNRAVTFNLGNAVLKGSPADNLRLEPGDNIALFTTAQMPLPLEKRVQIVTLSGEVNIPGQYQLQAGDTLPALIRRAGGLSANAFSYGIVFTRESTRQQQQDNLNKSIRRLEADISAQTASALQNVTDSEKGSALQAQIAGQRILLDRLKNLKASGRITLDLDPARPVLPAITLEDGDQITVPTQPSFVGVFGEVLAESAFIHRSGYTVADYLDKAGVTRDADLDNLMLIRADGSVEGSARRSSFLFSSGLTSKRLNPGDTIFVPGTIDRRTAYSQFIQGAKDWTAILYQFGLGAAALKTIRSSN
jgi:protein involved in polysaccharide export with SLBB domain